VKLKPRIKIFFLLSCLFSLNGSATEVSLSISPETIYPGRLVVIDMSTPYSIEKIHGDVDGHSIFLNKNENKNAYQALWPIDLQDHLGRRTVKIVLTLKDGRTLHFAADFDVVSKEYGRRDLAFQKDYDQKTLDRINAEKESVTKVLEKVSKEKLWNTSFSKPVEGPMSGEFGRRTFVQGEERNPHAGIDFAAPVGTTIKAVNDGTVLLINEDMFFEGKIILIDHGQGLLSMYVHLSKILVKKDQTVKRGDIIGEVGQTGRATGPHLHFGVKLFNKRIDPADIFNLLLL
jgi:murein DD-endopeptidase MepM/ murein hydrolase activator NlpD